MPEVTVRYFAAAADAAGVDEERVSIEGATLGDLQAALTARHGMALAKVMRIGSFLVDGVVRREPGHPVAARVDILPPFAGG
ncbi:MAG TPA: MoaD/ThiS family protein [Candidatus Lumbricidophila sp.]|nr:MoaD/ThiS family protein [Candidatus Lumbricidophila sp.]